MYSNVSRGLFHVHNTRYYIALNYCTASSIVFDIKMIIIRGKHAIIRMGTDESIIIVKLLKYAS